MAPLSHLIRLICAKYNGIPILLTSKASVNWFVKSESWLKSSLRGNDSESKLSEALKNGGFTKLGFHCTYVNHAVSKFVGLILKCCKCVYHHLGEVAYGVVWPI